MNIEITLNQDVLKALCEAHVRTFCQIPDDYEVYSTYDYGSVTVRAWNPPEPKPEPKPETAEAKVE